LKFGHTVLCPTMFYVELNIEHLENQIAN
jgi:hypothetical protein